MQKKGDKGKGGATEARKVTRCCLGSVTSETPLRNGWFKEGERQSSNEEGQENPRGEGERGVIEGGDENAKKEKNAGSPIHKKIRGGKTKDEVARKRSTLLGVESTEEKRTTTTGEGGEEAGAF